MYFRLAAASLLLGSLAFAERQKLTEDERIEIMRGLTAEYATSKIVLPRSKKALEFHKDGSYDKKQWEMTGKELGPAARVGDIVQVTHVAIERDRILLEINHGMKGNKKWYDHLEVGMGNSTQPVRRDQNVNAPSGTYIALIFPEDISAMPASDVKKMLAPILDFEKRSATETITAQLPPEIQAAVKANKVVEGMDRDTVILAVGKPRRKIRETKDGVDLEDWVYGDAPGRIMFVTFANNKVSKVKETYAELGVSTAAPLAVK